MLLTNRWLIVPILSSLAAPALAQTLDITGPYGNPDGCKFVKEGSVEGDQLLVLKPDGLQSYGTACQFVQVLPAKDGAKVVTGLCEFEGEDSVGVQMFAIRKSAKAADTFAIYDAEGSLWGEVKPCP